MSRVLISFKDFSKNLDNVNTMFNSFGTLFKITSFGESHGKVVGIVIDGCPSGLKISKEFIQKELDRRRPGQSKVSTSRSEPDKVEIISGVFGGITTGAPITMEIHNRDKDSSKYDEFLLKPRPSHADYPALIKYGSNVDLRGSGRFSGRNTAGFVMAGAVAKQLLEHYNIKIGAYTRAIGNIEDPNSYTVDTIIEKNETNPLRTIDTGFAQKMEDLILKVKKEEDSIGGIIECIIDGVPPGVGEPMFNSLESVFAHGLFSIPAVKGVEFGAGFKCAQMRGSEHNDPYLIKDGKIATKTNNAGGIVGGISTGMPIIFRIAIKPTASVGIKQQTVDLSKMENSELKITGRHDPCIVPRAVPVVEAIAACIISDQMLISGKIKRVLI